MPKGTQIKEEILIPDNVEVAIEKNIVQVKGEKGALSRILSNPRILIKKKEKFIEITCSDSPKRKDRAFIGTYVAHINNMIKGVSEGFTYKMKTVFSHFPIKTSVEGTEFIIQNFLGERSPRKALILEGVTVEVNGENVSVSGIDREKVGQTAANIERATRVKYRDIRVFQDGVYVVSKR